ncbi:MAG: hypothetical protein K8T26_02885 [Lentisphaerae bacterium]|nr:hypothetical protein [Lentisphaerota bacterium]
MADKKDDQLSPEEKLLRVIQGGGPKRKVTATATPPSGGASGSSATTTAAVGEVATAAGEVSTSGAPAADDKQRLKLAKAAALAPAEPAKPAAKPAGKTPAKAESKAKAMAPSKAVGVPKRAPSGTDLSVRTLNIVLAGVILIVLLLTGHEIWANVKVGETVDHVGGVSMPDFGRGPAQMELPSLDELIDALDQRALFAVATVVTATNQAQAQKAPPPSAYCALMGISQIAHTDEQEAIVMDKNLNKMMFLKVGDTVAADGQSWTVKEIRSDSVVFESGNEQSVVK